MILRHLRGILYGKPFLASLDRSGMRDDREHYAYIREGDAHGDLPDGYRAYIIESLPEESERVAVAAEHPDASFLFGVEDTAALCDFDVAEVTSGGRLHLLYRDQSSDNVLFITNQCNSNCIMCPDSETARLRPSVITKDFLLQLIGLIPGDTRFLTITGGEPTLMKWDLCEILLACREHFERTSFLLLTNGRSFSSDEYREKILECVPDRIRFGIPLHAPEAALHDRISGIPGSFAQTTYALLHLQHRITLEIRIVVSKLNYRFLHEIAAYIANHYPQTKVVCFMGLELLGSAALRRDMLWIDYSETIAALDAAAKILISSGIDMKIYNYPLCSLPNHLWSLAVQSISDYKTSYRPECASCSVRSACGGFFSSTVKYKGISVHPIMEDHHEK